MSRILGVDEVGRGPWAGPLCVGAVILSSEIAGLADSKKLTAKKRANLAAEIAKKSTYGLGWVSARELDKIGLSAALKLATIRAIEKIPPDTYDEIIIDGNINFLSSPQPNPTPNFEFQPLQKPISTLIKGDVLVPAISAASIIAKHARDIYMTKLAEKYPEYSFEHHVGYGTKLHRQTLEQYGPCPEHRQSFKPIAGLLGVKPRVMQDNSTAAHKNTTALGRHAERAVAECLTKTHDHEIIALNWRTRACEIDIVSQTAQNIYFTEVKYRKDDGYGAGLESIDARKLKQLRFAADTFIAANKVRKQPILLAAEVEGPDFAVKKLHKLNY